MDAKLYLLWVTHYQLPNISYMIYWSELGKPSFFFLKSKSDKVYEKVVDEAARKNQDSLCLVVTV